MRSETGRVLLLAAGGPAAPGQVSLSLLAQRITAARTAGPAPTYAWPVAAPRPVQAPTAAPFQDGPGPDAGCAGALPPGVLGLLGAHGGAGVTSLLRAGLGRPAVDCGRRWPAAGPVLLMARTSTHGLHCAQALARTHTDGRPGPVVLLGLVLLADAPGRLPARLSGLAELVAGGFQRCWRLGWQAEWRLAAGYEPLPVPPALLALRNELALLPLHAAAGPA